MRVAKAAPILVLGLLAMNVTPAYALLAPPPSSSSSGSTGNDVADLLASHNDTRAQHGLAPLRWSSGLADIALDRSSEMARAHQIWHDYAIGRHFGRGYVVGENVGSGPSADDVYAAFLDSDSHRANILDRVFDTIGIAAVRSDDGDLYVTVVFLSPARNTQPGATDAARTEASKKAAAKHPVSPPDRELSLLVELVGMEAR